MNTPEKKENWTIFLLLLIPIAVVIGMLIIDNLD